MLPEAWLQPVEKAFPETLRFCSWPLSKWTLSLDGALNILASYGLRGPWYELKVLKSKENPIEEDPNDQVYYSLKSTNGRRAEWYFVGMMMQHVRFLFIDLILKNKLWLVILQRVCRMYKIIE